jgi:hypothetical protein
MGPTDRGIWHCLPASGCGFWNVYVGRTLHVHVEEAGSTEWVVPMGTRQVDTKCRHCDRRHRFRIVRRDHRGGVRRVQFLVRPSNIAVEALIDEVNQLNRRLQLERDEIRFVRARDYRRGKND